MPLDIKRLINPKKDWDTANIFLKDIGQMQIVGKDCTVTEKSGNLSIVIANGTMPKTEAIAEEEHTFPIDSIVSISYFRKNSIVPVGKIIAQA